MCLSILLLLLYQTLLLLSSFEPWEIENFIWQTYSTNKLFIITKFNNFLTFILKLTLLVYVAVMGKR